ncbi:MAG: DUF4132 domain-containing protein [Phycisphaeraceae bacterium]|nr:DUF4132 domain-containing protein [Phycisphaerales bacterium]MCB9842313.1 DUF4132 domain-containing protein [Phycisphaeraceae bacterium]
MESNESIRANITELRDEKRTAKRVKKLPRNLRGVGDLITQIIRRPDKERSWTFEAEKAEDRDALIAKFFDGLSDDDRALVWNALFPKLSTHLERAWRDRAGMVYQHSYSRRPFRAPRAEKIARLTRARFFGDVIDTLYGIDEDAAWLAQYSPHLGAYWTDWRIKGWILAAAMNEGGRDGERVREVLKRSINGEDEIAQFGRHVVTALLNSERRSDWETIGGLLLAAQRQEGLRQAILESVDEASPGGFRSMLGWVIEHDLARFSAVVRAFDVWFGMQWAGGSTRVVNDALKRVRVFLDDDEERARAIAEGDAEAMYFALWTEGYSDASRALEFAVRHLNDADRDRRYIAHKIVILLEIPGDSLRTVCDRLRSGAECDEAIRWLMIDYLFCASTLEPDEELYAVVARELGTITSKSTHTEAVVWPWNRHKKDKQVISQVLATLAVGSPETMLADLEKMDPFQCAMAICELAGIGQARLPGSNKFVARERRPLNRAAREAIVRLTGSSAQTVHETAFLALDGSPVEPYEAEHYVAQLHRVSASFRACAIGRLAQLADDDALACIESLVTTNHKKKRSAGLEIAKILTDAERSMDRVRALIESHEEQLNDPELSEMYERIVRPASDPVEQDPYLGLLPDESLSEPIVCKDRGTRLETDAARRCMIELAEMVLQHSETEVESVQPDLDGGGTERCLFGQMGWRFERPSESLESRESVVESAGRLLPLMNVWTAWLGERSDAYRDKDGLELARAYAWITRSEHVHKKMLPEAYRGDRAYTINLVLQKVIAWLAALTAPEGTGAFFVQNAADAIAGGAYESEERLFVHDKSEKKPNIKWESLVSHRLSVCERMRSLCPMWFTDEDRARLAAMQLHALRTIAEVTTAPKLEDFGAAFDAGYVNEYDLILLMLAVIEVNGRFNRSTGYLQKLSRRRPHALTKDRPALLDAVERTRRALIDAELTRGEVGLQSTWLAMQLRFTGGVDVIVRVLHALGKDRFVRNSWAHATRGESFSRLTEVSAPIEEDTPAEFARRVKDLKIPLKRLLELAMYAPQWAGYVEHATGMAGLEDAVWWIHAHTKSRDLWQREDIRAIWESRINERTEIELNDLEDGAVDVAWFRRAMDAIGEKGWASLRPLCKYASTSGAHKRAELFASAIRGDVSEKELLRRIDEKRHQDSVRALGLVPLAKEDQASRREALRRYTRLQEFKRESRKFGSMRQTSEGRAVVIGLENLARTAGYRDTRRLEWSMETEAVADLAQGSVSVSEQETTVSLSIDEDGEPVLSVQKNGKPLKAIPAKLRKHAPFAELRSRVTDLRRQRSRMRLSLEDSMCRGDEFTKGELRELCEHPMLRPMLERLIFLGSGALAGYPIEGGVALRSHSGAVEPIGAQDTVRLAHPIDLLERGDWSDWQRDCFTSERVQPFKQVFREVYPRTEAELDGVSATRRYAGHQIQPRQALALFKQRQWIFSPEEGIRKVFHDQGLIAGVDLQEHFYTPADVDGATIETISFHKRSEYKGVSISDLCPRLFSEAMRDLDLVVSVAHAGGVDPEASASTIEMRSTLLRETCALLGLSNVRVDGHFVRIEGQRGSYTVHLGSANTTVQPARSLVIVAIHSQYRGRLFLPFADDDPKTAEVIAKALLLARDREIKDPSILAQIRG